MSDVKLPEGVSLVTLAEFAETITAALETGEKDVLVYPAHTRRMRAIASILRQLEATDSNSESATAEERAAWDRYAAAYPYEVMKHNDEAFAEVNGASAAEYADRLIAERRKRFGGGK